MAIRLIIVGLRRSGTTIFWESFLQDRALTCYDEPFNPLLERLPRTEGIKHPEAFVELLERDEATFRRMLRPIRRDEELASEIPEDLERYLNYLAATGEAVVLDTTRCHFRLEALARLAPEAVLLHLYRTPRCNATSHLLPSGGRRAIDRLRSAWRQRTFFSRSGHYNNWGFQDLVEGVGRERFVGHLQRQGIDVDAYYRLPAVGKLLGLWRVAHDHVETEGPRQFAGRFLSLEFDAFCADPHATLATVYAAMDRPLPELDLSAVRPAKPPFAADSERWADVERRLG